jgi:DNA-binding NarL/FixJ family response regulator
MTRNLLVVPVRGAVESLMHICTRGDISRECSFSGKWDGQPMKVLIVDDHALFREALGNTLRYQPDFESVSEAGTIAEALELADGDRPDVILLDVNLPDGSGLDALPEILKICPSTTVIMLTAQETAHMVFSAIYKGAKGYLMKNIPVSKLLASLRGLEKGEAALSRRMAGKLIDELARMHKMNGAGTEMYEETSQDVKKLLTPREIEVLKELADDISNREIARRLFIAENTVKIHIHRILKKLDLYNRHEAARLSRTIFQQ